MTEVNFGAFRHAPQNWGGLRKILPGGATRTILTLATLPVLLAR